MRLTRSQREQAKEELLEILSHGACRTSDLRGTQKFHGSRTLSSYQIRALLRETGKVREGFGGQGMRTFSYWTLAT